MSKYGKRCAIWVNMRKRTTGEFSNGEFFANEFDLLWQDERIHAIYLRPNGDYLSIETANIVWRDPTTGNRYFLGKSEIRLRPYDAKLVCVKAGETPKTDGFEIAHPVSGRLDGSSSGLYYMSASSTYPGNFCFGERNSYIRELIKQKEYFTLITTVLESLYLVNDEDQEAVRTDYRRIFPGEIIQAPRPKAKDKIIETIGAIFANRQ